MGWLNSSLIQTLSADSFGTASEWQLYQWLQISYVPPHYFGQSKKPEHYTADWLHPWGVLLLVKHCLPNRTTVSVQRFGKQTNCHWRTNGSCHGCGWGYVFHGRPMSTRRNNRETVKFGIKWSLEACEKWKKNSPVRAEVV